MENNKDNVKKYVVRDTISVCHSAPVYTKVKGDTTHIYCYDCDKELHEVSYIDTSKNIIMCFPDKKYMVHTAYDNDFGIDGDHDLMDDILRFYWFDLKARVQIKDKDSELSEESFIPISSGDYLLVMTGLKISMPSFMDLEIRPRSGLALKQGITVLNTPGTVDFNYRQEIGVILINLSKDKEYLVYNGSRIAQAKFNYNKPYMDIPNIQVIINKSLFNSFDKVFPTRRGLGGFGSTGIN